MIENVVFETKVVSSNFIGHRNMDLVKKNGESWQDDGWLDNGVGLPSDSQKHVKKPLPSVFVVLHLVLIALYFQIVYLKASPTVQLQTKFQLFNGKITLQQINYLTRQVIQLFKLALSLAKLGQSLDQLNQIDSLLE